jgi:hypothetical protein
MRYGNWLIPILALLLAALIMSACSGSDESSSGVARIEDTQPAEPEIKSAGPSNPPADTPVPLASEADTVKETDEEILTNFAACIRDHGFDVPDPEVNADGSLDLLGFRQSVGQNNPNILNSPALLQCLPLLAEATFAQPPSPENEVELQDNILEFAQCVRDEGIDVPDPEFSGGVRAAMGAMLQGAGGADSRVQEVFEKCANQIFNAGNPGR